MLVLIGRFFRLRYVKRFAIGLAMTDLLTCLSQKNRRAQKQVLPRILSVQPFKPSLEMTFATVQADCDRLYKYCRENKEAILSIDLSEITHCDSAGLALLIEAKRLSREKNKLCKIEGIPKVVQVLAEFCGVDRILIP
jgi:phospholipid transport system transporter-binding protein